MRLALRFPSAGVILACAASTTLQPVQPAGLSPPHGPNSVSVVGSDPHNMSVLYSNQSSDVHTSWSERVGGVLYTHETNGEPGTAVITWLSPGTANTVDSRLIIPGCGGHWWPCAFYRPGFRTDTVQPYQQTCVHFVAPSGQVAFEFSLSVATGGGVLAPPRTVPSGGIAWSSDSSWGFDGKAIKPAGTVDSSFDNVGKVWVRRVMQGC